MDTKIKTALDNLHRCLHELQEGIEDIYKAHESRFEYLGSRVETLEAECTRNQKVLKSVAELIMEELT